MPGPTVSSGHRGHWLNTLASSSSIETLATRVVGRALSTDAVDGVEHFGVRLGMARVTVEQSYRSTHSAAIRTHGVITMFVRWLIVGYLQ